MFALSYDLWVLPNGNLLFNSGHGVKEVTRAKEVVFDYPSKSEIYACQRLPDGNTLICNWLGHDQFGKSPHLVEVTPDKRAVWSFADHQALRTISNVVLLDGPKVKAP